MFLVFLFKESLDFFVILIKPMLVFVRSVTHLVHRQSTTRSLNKCNNTVNTILEPRYELMGFI